MQKPTKNHRIKFIFFCVRTYWTPSGKSTVIKLKAQFFPENLYFELVPKIWMGYDIWIFGQAPYEFIVQQ